MLLAARSCLLIAWLGFLAAGWHLSHAQSATFDEVPHLGAGVLYLSGDLRFNREHPPLTKVLAALAAPRPDPGLQAPGFTAEAGAEWVYGDAYIHGSSRAPLEILRRARMPLVVLCSLLVPVAWLWALRMAGPAAAALAALLTGFSPLWLAHGSLVHTDGALTLFAFAASWLAWEALRADGRRWRWCVALGGVIALGMAAKYSMGVVVLGLVVAGAVAGRERWRELLPYMGALAGGTALGLLFSWGLPPAPDVYLEGMRRVGGNHVPGYTYYAFGEHFEDRNPSYFTRALAVKVSVATWLALVFGLFALLRARGERARADIPVIAIVPLTYLLVLSWNAPALGVRYVLPVLPFVALAGAVLIGRHLPRLRAWIAVSLLSFLQIASAAHALSQSPLSWFNGLGCWTGQVPPCLDDSNVDWGHALPALGAHMDRAELGMLRLLYFGSARPEAYDARLRSAHPAELQRPQPAVYAVSLHILVRAPSSSWVHEREPDAVVAGAYAIYDLRAAGTP